jgi:hypothetical protein
VDHQHLYSRVGRLRLMARIQLVGAFINNALFRGTSCQQQRQQERGSERFIDGFSPPYR